ncbi:MAG: hypothetical protein WC061_06040 [Melioribacteraceae bacterium]
MKPLLLILLSVLPHILISAQEKSVVPRDKKKLSDTSAVNKILPPRTLIIKTKDLDEIKKLNEKQFIIIDDTSHYTNEELASGLSAEELARYKINKNKIMQLLTTPQSEEDKYPTVSTIRKILGIAKTAAVIIILILSIL